MLKENTQNIPKNIAFSTHTIEELYQLPKLLQKSSIDDLQEISQKTWGGVFPPCSRCYENPAMEENSLCRRCSLFEELEEKNLPRYGIWVYPQKKMEEESFYSNFSSLLHIEKELLILSHTWDVGKNLLHCLDYFQEKQEMASIAVFLLPKGDYSPYHVGDILALIHHHIGYFSQRKLQIKFFQKLRKIASLDYATDPDMFHDAEHCRFLLKQAHEFKKIMGKDNISCLQKILRENRDNRLRLLQNLFYLCNLEQKKFLMEFDLENCVPSKISFLLELTRYVE